MRSVFEQVTGGEAIGQFDDTVVAEMQSSSDFVNARQETFGNALQGK